VDQESETPGWAEELLVARFEIEEAGAPVNADISAALKGIKGVKAIAISNGAIEVTYDPLQTSEKRIEEVVRHSGIKPSRTEIGWESPHPDLS
jgi:copper chaperone CopZ